jgi:hypothetical protein
VERDQARVWEQTRAVVGPGKWRTPRLLKLFQEYNQQTSWFIPDHLIGTLPNQLRMVADARHEIGGHGYLHENPEQHPFSSSAGLMATRVATTPMVGNVGCDR